MRTLAIVAILAAGVGWRPGALRAQETKPEAESAPALGVEEVVARTNLASYYQGADGRARVEMTITDGQGRQRSREFTILRRNQAGADAAGDQKFYVYFQRPADVNKMVLLVWKKSAPGQEDNRWLYLPALDLVKRIAGTEKRTSFVGSDFFYEDVSGRGLHEDIHELAETGENYYVLKNTPKDPKAVEFSSYAMWIHKGTFLPVRIEYYDAAGDKLREYSALAVETVQGHPTVTQSRMKNYRTGSETTMKYGDVAYDLGLPEDIFTERYLKNPPREYLR